MWWIAIAARLADPIATDRLPHLSSSDNDVRLCEVSVSRHACRIHFTAPGRARLELLGSTQVMINEHRILPLLDSDEPVYASLAHNDLLTINKYRFRFTFHYESNSSGSSSSSKLSQYTAMSPSSSGRLSQQHLATPQGTRRKLRLSLVNAADINTPNKAQAITQTLDEMEEAEEEDMSSQQSANQGPSIYYSLPSLRRSNSLQGLPVGHSVMVTDRPLSFSAEGLQDVSSVRFDQLEAEEVEEDEQVVVVEEDEEEEEEPPAPTPVPTTPQRKEKRRSSFLGRAWPFSSSSQGFYAEEQQPDPESSPLQQDEDTSSQRLEAEEQADFLPPLLGDSPRLPRSSSSPGRLGASPSFHLSSRRKVSLRTKTLLKSSAALVERMAAEQNMSPSRSLSPREMTLPVEAEGDEDEVDQSLSLAEEEEPAVGEDSSANRSANQVEAGMFEVQEATYEEDAMDEDEDIFEEQIEAPAVPTTLPTPTAVASKRLSMPAFFGRRSFFGLLPKLRSSNEAEDVTGKGAAAFASQDTESDTGSEGVLADQSMLPPETVETLRVHAREALKYLLSHKPVVAKTGEGNISPRASLISSGRRSGGLRELVLGQSVDSAALLQERRRSISASGTVLNAPSSDHSEMSSAGVIDTPATSFLRQIFTLPSQDTDADPQLKALRDLFQEHETCLNDSIRDDSMDEDDETTLALLLATPAAHRALVGAAASVARLTPTESALQASATLEADHSVRADDSVSSDGQDQPLRHKKTRRGCRGGRRRSKSHSPSVDLGAESFADLIADVTPAVDEPIEEDPVREQEEEKVAAEEEPVQTGTRFRGSSHMGSETLLSSPKKRCKSQTAVSNATPIIKSEVQLQETETPSRRTRKNAQNMTPAANHVLQFNSRISNALPQQIESQQALESIIPGSAASSPVKTRGKGRGHQASDSVSSVTRSTRGGKAAAKTANNMMMASSDPVEQQELPDVTSPVKSRRTAAQLFSETPRSSPRKPTASARKDTTKPQLALPVEQQDEVVEEAAPVAASKPKAATGKGKKGSKASSTAARQTQSSPVKKSTATARRGNKKSAVEEEETAVEVEAEEEQQPVVQASKSTKAAITRSGSTTRGSRKGAGSKKSSNLVTASEPVGPPESDGQGEEEVLLTRSGRAIRKPRA